eukprot:3832937-Pleurochrysis_carterae.AAC.1
MTCKAWPCLFRARVHTRCKLDASSRAHDRSALGLGAQVDATGSSVTKPFMLETYWEHPHFVHGNQTGDGSW